MYSAGQVLRSYVVQMFRHISRLEKYSDRQIQTQIANAILDVDVNKLMDGLH